MRLANCTLQRMGQCSCRYSCQLDIRKKGSTALGPTLPEELSNPEHPQCHVTLFACVSLAWDFHNDMRASFSQNIKSLAVQSARQNASCHSALSYSFTCMFPDRMGLMSATLMVQAQAAAQGVPAGFRRLGAWAARMMGPARRHSEVELVKAALEWQAWAGVQVQRMRLL